MTLLISRKTTICHQTHSWNNVGLLMISLCMYIISFSFFLFGGIFFGEEQGYIVSKFAVINSNSAKTLVLTKSKYLRSGQKTRQEFSVCTVILNSFPCSPPAIIGLKSSPTGPWSFQIMACSSSQSFVNSTHRNTLGGQVRHDGQ